jgi:hypothetical protein
MAESRRRIVPNHFALCRHSKNRHLINEDLRSIMRRKQESREATLRRVIRDQIRRAG